MTRRRAGSKYRDAHTVRQDRGAPWSIRGLEREAGRARWVGCIWIVSRERRRWRHKGQGGARLHVLLMHVFGGKFSFGWVGGWVSRHHVQLRINTHRCKGLP